MSEIFVKKTERYYSISDWEASNNLLVAGFTTKNGGCSEMPYSSLNMGYHVGDDERCVTKNRQLLAQDIEMPLTTWVGAEQTHRSNIIKITDTDKGRGAADYTSAFRDTDGFYTNEKNILLTLCYADCVPIYFYAPASGYIGMVHAGWKGTVAKIAAEMVTIWQAEGISPEEIKVVIGPSICGSCYIVDDRIIDQVKQVCAQSMPYREVSKGQYELDLKKLNESILQEAGVKDIDVSNFCTSCAKEDFFSHRRDQGKTGRLMSFIGWKEDFVQSES
ncbi:MAG: peptidoglycan editing factor PgeF [Bacillus sp. (in: firmicutes)]